MFAGVGLFLFSKSPDHSCLNVSDVVRLMGSNRAEKKSAEGGLL